MKTLYHLGKQGLTEGKVAGILVCCHEDGPIRTDMDVWPNLQQPGFILAPFGITFRTHGSQFNSSTDREFVRSDELIVRHTLGTVNNVIGIMQLAAETKLKGKLVSVRE